MANDKKITAHTIINSVLDPPQLLEIIFTRDHGVGKRQVKKLVLGVCCLTVSRYDRGSRRFNFLVQLISDFRR